MRGWFSLLTSSGDPRTYRTGILIASAEPDVLAKVFPAVRDRFPRVCFTYLISRSYMERCPWMRDALEGEEILWTERMKANLIRSVMAWRGRGFDLCVVVWPGRPSFLLGKAAAFWLNVRKIIVYNENADSFCIDRADWRYVRGHFRFRIRRQPSAKLFYPLGFAYLLGRTLWLYARTKVLRPNANGARMAEL